MNFGRDEESDEALWGEALRGIGRSFACIYDRHRQRVFRAAHRRTVSLQDAEDVVALTFFEAWRMRERVRVVDGSLLPWLLSVTARVALNFTRAQHRYRAMLSRLPPALDEDDHSDVVAERIAHASRVQRILLALKNLAPVDRAVVDLCLIEELPMDAAAKVLAVPSGTVKSRLHEARRQLRIELEDVHAVMGD